jgi:hypothetical protein
MPFEVPNLIRLDFGICKCEKLRHAHALATYFLGFVDRPSAITGLIGDRSSRSASISRCIELSTVVVEKVLVKLVVELAQS